MCRHESGSNNGFRFTSLQNQAEKLYLTKFINAKILLWTYLPSTIVYAVVILFPIPKIGLLNGYRY